MSSKSKNNMMNMTEGNPLGLLIRFSIPMLIGNLFQQLYNLADSVIVGKLVGSDALAAVGATSSITFMFFALCNGIGSAGGIVTSQSFGRGDEKGIKRCITNTGYIMFVFPLIVGIIAFFIAGPILEFLKTPADIMHDSLMYLRVMCVGLMFVSVYNYISSILRALGDSKTPLYFLVFSCFLNIILDVIFVYVLKTGVVGAAIATLVSQFTSGICCTIFAFSKNPYFKFAKEDLAADRDIILSVVKLGVPLSLQFSLIAISCMALQRVVNSFGAVAIAAFTATSRIEQLIHQPYSTLGSSLSTYTGQNYGAGKRDRIIKGYHQGLIMMAVFSAVMLPIMQFFGANIMRLFVNEVPVIEMGAMALKITSWFYVFLGLIYVVRGVLNGLSDSFFALFNGIIEVFGRVFVPTPLTMIAAIGVWGIWGSVGIVWFISGATAWFRYLYFMKKKITI
ncbi:MAG: MATE family efflux transporter [Lachnospiraceae bacterium]|nr:MATE family efflux transporter [Lachnospiraceae bacterium]